MGKAARQHRSVTGFTSAEAPPSNSPDCSAHWNAVELKQSGELLGGASASETVGFVNRPDENWIRTVYNMDGKKR